MKPHNNYCSCSSRVADNSTVIVEYSNSGAATVDVITELLAVEVVGGSDGVAATEIVATAAAVEVNCSNNCGYSRSMTVTVLLILVFSNHTINFFGKCRKQNNNKNLFLSSIKSLFFVLKRSQNI